MTVNLETIVVLTGLITFNITLFRVDKIDIHNMFNRVNVSVNLNLHNHFHGDIEMEKVKELNREQAEIFDKACEESIVYLNSQAAQSANDA